MLILKKEQKNLKSDDHKILLLMLTFTVIAQLAITIYLPSLLTIARQLHVSFLDVQHSFYLFLVAYGASQLFYGPLSDHYGRKKILLIGLSIFMMGVIAMIIAKSLTMLLLARLIQGLGAGSISVLARAILRDRFSGVALKVASSTLSMVSNFTPIIAPVIGGHLQFWFGWQANFIFLLAYTLVSIALIMRFLPETQFNSIKSSFNLQKILKQYLGLLKNRTYIFYVGGAVLMFACQTFYLSFSPVIFQDHFHLSSKSYGNVLIVPALGYLLGNLFNSHFAKKIESKYLIKGGLFLIIVGGGVLFLTTHLMVMTTIVISVIMLGIGIVFPNMIANALEPFPNIAGTAAALLGFFQMVGSSVAGSLVSLIAQLLK